MAGLTDIAVCSQALLRLGASPIQSFEGVGKPAICGEIYPEHRRHCLSLHPWKFAKEKFRLSREADSPLNEWAYQFQLPATQLNGPLAVFRYGESRPYKHFEIQGDKLLSDADDLVIDFLGRPPENKWPPYFVTFVVLSLAAELALPVAGSRSLHEIFDEKAWGLPSEGRHGGEFAVARRADSRREPVRQVMESGGPLIRARHGALGRFRKDV